MEQIEIRQVSFTDLEQEPEQEYIPEAVPEAEYTYKGFIIRVEQRVDPMQYIHDEHVIYKGDKRLAACDINAVRHVIDSKLRLGVWQNV